MAGTNNKVKVGLLTVSDRCFLGAATDSSGPNLKNLINRGSVINGEVVVTDCVPDEERDITSHLIQWSDNMKLGIIFTIGGTGFAPRDITPEATKRIIEREAPGMALAMIKGSLDITPLAMLSRPICGIRKLTLIVNLPGSAKASEECFRIVAPALQHAVDLLQGNKPSAESTHAKLQSEGVKNSDKPSQHTHHCKHHSKNLSEPLPVAYRPRESTFPMLSVEAAQKIVLEKASALEITNVSYTEALNHVLAEDILAKDPLPPFPASVKDGYAVIAADGAGPRKVTGSSTAGSGPEDLEVKPGFCARISTGAPLPPGADAVVMVEYTKLLSASEDGKEEFEIEIVQKPVAGQEIRPVGCDIAVGEKILEKGTLLGPSEIGLLATVGAVNVSVYKVPKVAVLSTGNELQEPSPGLEVGKIRDSNRPSLLSLLRQHQIPSADMGIAKDDLASLSQALEKSLRTSDIIVSSGGVSMGEKDLLRQVLVSHFGAEVHFARVDMKPGKPTTFATLRYEGKTKLFFGLPGNPVSAVVTAHLYLLPACRSMSGHPRPLFPTVRAVLAGTEDFSLDSRPEYHRVGVGFEAGRLLAQTTGGQMSSRLMSMSSANGLAVLPAKAGTMDRVRKGDEVDVILIGSL